MNEYIVVNEKGKPMELGKYDEGEPRILWDGKHVTKFNNFNSAKNAITRSAKYAEKNKLPWRVEEYEIKRLVDFYS